MRQPPRSVELVTVFSSMVGYFRIHPALQAVADMVRLAPVMLQALPDTEVWVCVGEFIAGALALDPPALANVPLYWLVPLVRVFADETEHPRLMQLIGSSGLQSPPPCERMCARSPDPT